MKVLILGCQGRMGKKLTEYCFKNNTDCCGIDVQDKKINSCGADVIIDFSTKDALYDNLLFACQNKLPIIVATTGHDNNAYQLMSHYSKSIPVMVAPNLSLQFNVMCGLVNKLSCLKDNQFILQETHHKNKKDAPSGSAKQLIDILSKIDILPMTYSVRAGDVVGEHKLDIYGEQEKLTIQHIATDRMVYCKGALCAAEYILTKQKGLYTMENLIDEYCK